MSKLWFTVFIIAAAIAGLVWRRASPDPLPQTDHSEQVAPRLAPPPLASREPAPPPGQGLPVGGTPAGFPAGDAFLGWVKEYSEAGGRRAEMVGEGVQLASARRMALKQLIARDPERALAVALDPSVRLGLPAEVLAQLEERFETVGDLRVIEVCRFPQSTSPAPSPRMQTLEVEGRFYRAFPVGSLGAGATKPAIPLAAVTLDDWAAVGPATLRVLAADAAGAGDFAWRLRPGLASERVTLREAGTGELAVSVAGRNFLFPRASTPTLPDVAAVLRSAEERAGALPKALDPEWIRASLPSAGGIGGPAARPALPQPATAWSTGPVRILFVRVDFSDLPGPPRAGYTPEEGFSYRDIDPALVDAAINGAGGIRRFFEDSSYGRTTLQVGPADVTPVLRLPNTALSYATADPATSIYTLHNQAEQAAIAAGWPMQQYDRIAVVWSNLGLLPGSRIGYFGGLGEVGGRRLWFQGYFAPSAVAHEIGHTYGFPHANRWKTRDGTVTGAGESAEYGDPSDQMGGGAYGGVNPWFRQRAGWLPENAIRTPRVPGVIRLQRFDRQAADLTSSLAVRIPDRSPEVNGNRDFWLALRGARFSGRGDLTRSGYLFWGYTYSTQSQLLDTRTPGDDNGADAGLAIDGLFHERGLALRTLAAGGEEGAEFLDVQILALPGNPGYGPARSLVRAVRGSVSAAEADGFARIEFERLDGTAGELRLTASTRDGTARAGEDYQATTASLVWAAGEPGRKALTVPLRVNGAAEGGRVFRVDLSNVAGGTVVGDASVTVVIGKAGALDPGWGNDPGTLGFVSNVVPLPDGGCVGLREFYNYDLARYQVRVVRFGPDGSEVAGFAPAPFETAFGHKMARQADGRLLLVAGFPSSNPNNTSNEPRLVRLLEDGAPDASFTSISLGRSPAINRIVPLPDGRILVAGDGFAPGAATTYSMLLRLLADGTIDPAFVRPSAPFLSSYGIVYELQPLPDGKILIAGDFGSSVGGQAPTNLARLLPDGSLDPSFTLQSYGPGYQAVIYNMAVDGDGRIFVAGGFTTVSGVSRTGLAALEPSGTLIRGFAPVLTTDAASLAVFPVLSLPGRVLTSGNFTRVNGTPRSGLISLLTADGSIDRGFQSNIKEYLRSAVPASDGRIFLNLEYKSVARLLTGAARSGGGLSFAQRQVNAEPGATVTVQVLRNGGSAGAARVVVASDAADVSAGNVSPLSEVLSWTDGDASPRSVAIRLPAGARRGREVRIALGPPLGAIGGEVQSVRVLIGGSGAPPELGSGLVAQARIAEPFSWVVPAQGAIDSLSASGLPPGLALDAATRTIRGTALMGGSFPVRLRAENGYGAVESVLNLEVLSRFSGDSRRLVNLSTRARVEGGQGVLIGGFVVSGVGSKRVLVRALGPSLTAYGVTGALSNPNVQIADARGAILASNDDWESERAEVSATGLSPGHPQEAAVVQTLPPGSYTAIVRGASVEQGVALVEVYDLDPAEENAKLINLSTRGSVRSGDAVMIAGFVVTGPQPKTVVVRALGPSLGAFGIVGPLADPTLRVVDRTGGIVGQNDNWRQDVNAAQVQSANLAPGRDAEAALHLTLAPGSYTVIVEGKNGGSGIAIAEVYEISP